MGDVLALPFRGTCPPVAPAGAVQYVVLSHAMAALHDMLLLMQTEDEAQSQSALDALYHDSLITWPEYLALYQMLFGRLPQAGGDHAA